MSSAQQRKVSNLRTASYAALVILLIEIGIGMGVNLFSTIPGDGAGKSLFAAFGEAVTNGPLALTMHALIGTIVLVSGIAAVVWAFRVRRTTPTLLSCAAMLALLVAWLSGSRFVVAQDNATSISMAVASIIGSLCYATILFVLPLERQAIQQNE